MRDTTTFDIGCPEQSLALAAKLYLPAGSTSRRAVELYEASLRHSVANIVAEAQGNAKVGFVSDCLMGQAVDVFLR